MNRADKVQAQVAAEIQDSGAICEAITDAIKAAFHEGDEASIIADIAHHVAEASNGVTQAHRESHAHLLLNAMERYVRVVLTEKAEDDIAQDDEESDEYLAGFLCGLRFI